MSPAPVEVAAATPARRDVVLQVSGISLDGFIALAGTPFDEQTYQLADPERDRWMADSLEQAGVHVMGRVTYESMAGYWPGSTEVFAEPMNRIPKAVFSRSLPAERATWGEDTRILRGELADELAGLTSEPGPGVVLAHGGARFDQSLAAADLVDEYRLVVYPFAVGSGTALFAGLTVPRRLRLTQAVPFPSGCVAMVYRRAGARDVGPS